MATKISVSEFEKRYKLIRELGNGTFGKVYEYKDQERDRGVAVKQIQSSSFESFTNSIQELTLLSRLQHQNIINIYQYCIMREEQKILGGGTREIYNVYLLMELGEYSLDYEIVNRHKQAHHFSIKSLYYLIVDLVEALSYMQENQISHRDIKPHNILKVRGVYKLTDFGVSKSFYQNNENQNSQTLTGSPSFLAPNLKIQYEKGLTQATHNQYKSDVFSLGLVILCAASLKDITGLNSDEGAKNLRIDEIFGSKLYTDSWLHELLTKTLEYDESNRWDFRQLKSFLGQISFKQVADERKKPSSQKDLLLTPNNEKSVLKQSEQTTQLTLSEEFHRAKAYQSAPDMAQKQQESIKRSEELARREDTFMQQKFSIKNQIELVLDSESLQTNKEPLSLKSQSDEQNQGLVVGFQEALKSLEIPPELMLLGSTEKEIYKGNVDQKGQKSGQGIHLRNGVLTLGSWKSDKLNGYARQWNLMGQIIYEGHYFENLKHGKGKLYTPKEVYEGEFEKDEFEGRGTLISSDNNEKYEGDWLRSLRHGYGIQKYFDDTLYDGYWIENQKSGYGILQRSDKTIIYQGDWEENKYHGDGKLLLDYQKKKYYEGPFLNGVQHGTGFLYKLKTPQKKIKVKFNHGKLLEDETNQ